MSFFLSRPVFTTAKKMKDVVGDNSVSTAKTRYFSKMVHWSRERTLTCFLEVKNLLYLGV